MNSLLLLLTIAIPVLSAIGNNRCHFTNGDKLFILKQLQVSNYYEYNQDNNNNQSYIFNFCNVVNPPEGYNCRSSYSMVLNHNNMTCVRYSSDSLNYFSTDEVYQGQNQSGIVVYQIQGDFNAQTGTARSTKLVVICEEDEDGFNIQEVYVQGDIMYIHGNSKYGCPLLVVSGLWQALADNQIIFGLVLFGVGVMELFFGRKMLQPTIFVACYCISFAILGAIISQLFIRPNSTFLRIYICLIVLIFASSILGYFAMRLTHISIFFIGAWMGLIVAVLVNSIFIKLFSVYSTWSLVVFAIVFCMGLGLLTFKLYDQIIILSTSLSGAYMIVRPISWIFGGFPNEFLLANLIKEHQISTLPSTFFIYFAVIIALTTLGAIYQFLQLKREKMTENQGTMEIGKFEQKLQESVDAVRMSLNNIINKYKRQDSDDQQKKDRYIQFKEIKKNNSNNNRQSFSNLNTPVPNVTEFHQNNYGNNRLSSQAINQHGKIPNIQFRLSQDQDKSKK